jgi:hypothetical protein
VSRRNFLKNKYLTGGWIGDAITFYAYHTGSETASTFNNMIYQIWKGPPNDPASSMVIGDTSSNRLVSTDWTNIYRVSETRFDTQRPSKTPLPACLTRIIPPEVDAGMGGSESDRCEELLDSSLLRIP